MEISLEKEVIRQAQQIFRGIWPSIKQFMDGGPGRYKQLEAVPGNPLRFFGVNRHGWASDVAWISVDDPYTYNRFQRIYQKMMLPQIFEQVVDHDTEIRLFSAFFVVRKKCNESNMHVDYWPNVGSNALTLMTPLEDYESKSGGFGLLYQALNETVIKRYHYRKNKAIVFGARFTHSTEPGEGQVPQAYLCMQFGSDKKEHWNKILETINYQSRFVMAADGLMRPTELGLACGKEWHKCVRGLVV